MKKVVLVITAALLLLAGCGEAAVVSSPPSASVQPAVSTEQTVAPAPSETASPEPEDALGIGVNMVQNGDFSNAAEGWHLFLTSGGSAQLSGENGEGVVNISSCGGNDYSVQLYYDGFKLETGGVYKFTFDARCSVDRQIAARLQLNGGDYKPYVEKFIDITTEMQTYEIEMTMEDGTDPAPRLCFNIGTPQNADAPPANIIYFDNIGVTLVDGSNIVVPEPEAPRPDINVNQIGYEPDDTKIAVLRGEGLGDAFQVVAQNGSVAYEGQLAGPVESEPSAETNYTADFSALTAEGVYTVKCGSAESYPFAIAQGVYEDAFKAAFKMLYLQRCGSELTADFAGSFAHPACHTGEAVIYGTDEKKDVSGGWHDAGDYGRYVVSGAKAVADLLFAYEDYKDVMSRDDLGIPESGNGVPDVLDEARYELEWMLKMQDESGGVYHKVTGLAFPGFVMPQDETEQMYILPVSGNATADFAAVMAMSYVDYRDIDSAFANTCLKAAKKAWTYLEEKPGGGFQNPTDVATGEYGNGDNSDERYWAAAALYRATGESKYIEAFEKALKIYIAVLDGYGWADVGDYGNKIYLSLDPSALNPEYVQKVKDALKKTADKYLTNSQADAYGMSLGLVYPWGSNMTVCDNARYLTLASQVLGNSGYAAAADRHFNYIFGANPLSICYVTGFGTVSPVNSHHRPSAALEQIMPGMLAGGPDSNLEDPFATAVLLDAPPQKCYVDNEQSFSTNEVAIYWNSPLIYLLAQKLSN